MTPDAHKCLQSLNNWSEPDGEMCRPFRTIMDDTGFDRKTVRRHIRAAWRKGLAEYFRGLCTEDGEPAGAGYCITHKGRKLCHTDQPYVRGKFCIHANCQVWFPDDGPACPNHTDSDCSLRGPTDTGKEGKGNVV